MSTDVRFSQIMFNTGPLTIYPAGCKQQKEDLAILLHALDDFGATALALSSKGAQSYSTFIEARDQLREHVRDTFEKYRLVKDAA